MKVSVITVCYNSEATILRCLQSVCMQSYENIEHIVIDGASTDRTLQIIRECKFKHVTLVSQEDLGIYDAMNRGIQLATGDVVCFLNSDDWYVSKTILRDVVYEMKRKDLEVVLTDILFVSPTNPKKIVRAYRAKKFKPTSFKWGFMPPHPGVFLRRNVVNRVGEYNIKYKIASDFEYLLRVFKDKNLKWSYIERISVYMQHGGLSTSGLMSNLVILKEVKLACLENGVKSSTLMLLCKIPGKILSHFVRI